MPVRMLTLSEVAKMCATHPSTIAEICQAGIIGCKTPNGKWLIEPEDARALRKAGKSPLSSRLDPDRIDYVRTMLKLGKSIRQIEIHSGIDGHRIKTYAMYVLAVDNIGTDPEDDRRVAMREFKMVKRAERLAKLEKKQAEREEAERERLAEAERKEAERLADVIQPSPQTEFYREPIQDQPTG